MGGRFLEGIEPMKLEVPYRRFNARKLLDAAVVDMLIFEPYVGLLKRNGVVF